MVLGSWPKNFLNHHALGNAVKKQEAASFGLKHVIFPVDFTVFPTPAPPQALNLYIKKKVYTF